MAAQIVAGHYLKHRGYVSWSGGKDSDCIVHLARQLNPAIPVCWFDSGLEYPETRAHIETLAEQWDLNLHVYRCEPTALEWMARSGHWDMDTSGDLLAAWGSLHDTLIARPARLAQSEHGDGVIMGLRAEESSGRRRLVDGAAGKVTTRTGARWCCPIGRWTARDTLAYHHRWRIPLNPVYAKMEALGVPAAERRVGVVIDGNALQYGRGVWLRRGWPDLWQELVTALPRLKEMS